MDVKVSVIIPCYNMGDYVMEAVNSVLSYPYQDIIEIIIINDGSNDNGYTKQILDAIDNDNITIVHQENFGLGKARNNGINLAKGDYVLPLDADNKIRHEYIDNGISILDSNPNIGICYGNLKQFGTSNLDVIVGSFDASKLIVKNYIDACVMLRKEAWRTINGYDENMPVMGYEDWDINLRLFFSGWKFQYINTVLFDYRLREDSMLVNSNQNRALLLDYMFSKPELKQAALLRVRLLGHDACKKELESIKNRRLMRIALKIEKVIKNVIKIKR